MSKEEDSKEDFVTMNGTKGLSEVSFLILSKKELQTILHGMDKGITYSLCLFDDGEDNLQFSFLPIISQLESKVIV